MAGTTWQLVLQAGAFVKAILVVLAACSVVSWGVILYKALSLRAASRASRLFLDAFDAADDPQELLATAQRLQTSPLASVFAAAGSASVDGRQPLADRREDLARWLRRAESAETDRLESYLVFLATIGSTAPFIGLFGTVWGIMDAFRGIGTAGSASLAVVSPAIAEALIATAAGLAAAIPAVMAYNYFVSRVRKMSQELAQFTEELHTVLAQRVA